MACKDCTGKFADIRHTCAVCELVNNDSSIKRVRYCDECKVYICEAHWKDYISRGIAAIKSLFTKKFTEQIKQFNKDAEETEDTI